LSVSVSRPNSARARVGLGWLFAGVDPVPALYYSAVIKGVVAVPQVVIIFLIGNNGKILGERTSGKLSNSLGNNNAKER